MLPINSSTCVFTWVLTHTLTGYCTDMLTCSLFFTCCHTLTHADVQAHAHTHAHACTCTHTHMFQ